MKIPSWLIPAILLIVSIDLWVSATGESDPYKLSQVPFTSIIINPAFSIASMARGIGIVLAVTYGIHALRLLLTAEAEWMRKIGRLLLILISGMLLIETTVITPYLVTSMADTGIAKTLRAINLFGQPTGEVLYFGWALMVAIMPLLGVIISAIASIASDVKQAQMSTVKKIVEPRAKTPVPASPPEVARNTSPNTIPPIPNLKREPAK